MVINFLKPKVTIYDKCENLPLWNFQKYLETNDVKYFAKEHKEHKDLPDIITAFFGEYLELTKNQKIIIRFERAHKIMRLTIKYNTVSLILKTLYNYNKGLDFEIFKQLVEELQKWNYKIDKNKDIFEQLEKIYNRIQGIKTQIEVLEDELKDEDVVESSSIDGQLISVSRCLDLKYQLNAKEITVLQWIEYQKQAVLIIKERQKHKK
jgi:hypothetical protein